MTIYHKKQIIYGYIILYKTINVIQVYIRPFGLLLPNGPSVCLIQWTFKLFGFPIWGWLFQENVVCTKLDTYSVIYVPVNVVFFNHLALEIWILSKTATSRICPMQGQTRFYSEWVIVVFNTKWVFFRYIMARSCYILMRW